MRRTAVLGIFVALVCGLVPGLGTSAPTLAAPGLFGRVADSFHPEDGKIFILVIGTDARGGNPDARADAIHIVGIDTKTMKAGVLNFPRDSWVSIPGYGTGKINEAVYHGGPQLLAQTLRNLTGIPIDYYVMVGFDGFRDILDALDGVKMRFANAVHDSAASARIPAGIQNLGGAEALAYARARKAFSAGDVARTTHQGDILVALLRKLHRQIDYDPGALLRWIALTKNHARLDLPADEMFRLGVVATQLDPKDVGNVTVPVSVGSVGAASVVFISPSARSIYARFKANASL